MSEKFDYVGTQSAFFHTLLQILFFHNFKYGTEMLKVLFQVCRKDYYDFKVGPGIRYTVSQEVHHLLKC